MSPLVWLALPGALLWLLVLALPWRPWSCRESLDVDDRARPARPADLSGLTVLIPARNEARHIRATLSALREQGPGLRVVVVDDQSADDTAALARAAALPGLQLHCGLPPPAGWSGKLWALEQGLAQVRTPYVLLLDADIQLQPGIIARLLQQLQGRGLGLASLMARLRMQGFWERLLLPPFVFFFKLLYPFSLVNRRRCPLAGAAGGVLLTRRSLLTELSGFAALRTALIDDCALARAVKSRGHGIWLGLTRSAHSSRCYPDLAAIWQMVTRTAYSQLHYSPWRLLLASVLLVAAFVLPAASVLLGALYDAPGAIAPGAVALAAMLAAYLPTLRYYQLASWRAPGLVIAGVLFLAMTWHSCLRHHWGRGACWKGRRYTRRPERS